MKTPSILWVVIVAIGLLSVASGADTDNVALQLSKFALECAANGSAGIGPKWRTMAITHSCMFEAWSKYDGAATGYFTCDNMRQPKEEWTTQNKEKAIVTAAYYCLIFLRKDLGPKITETMITSFGLGLDDNSTSSVIGRYAADAVTGWAQTDGSNQFGDLMPYGEPYSDWTGYEPVNSPSLGRPKHLDQWTPMCWPLGSGVYVNEQFIHAHWSKMQPIALKGHKVARKSWGAPVPARQKEQFLKKAETVLQYSASLDDQEKANAEYWPSKGTAQLAYLLNRRDQHDLDKTVQHLWLYFVALHDVTISVWDAKRKWDSDRPIKTIRTLFEGKYVRAWMGPKLGVGYIDGARWVQYLGNIHPLVGTSEPEFPSGMTAMCSAGATINQLFSGGSEDFNISVTVPTGSSTVEPGITPSHDVTINMPTFSAAKQLCGRARVSAGVHYEETVPPSIVGGTEVGRLVFERLKCYLTPCKLPPKPLIQTNPRGNKIQGVFVGT